MTANLAELLARAAAGSPDRVALVDAGTGRRLTWGELDDAVSRVAGGLAEQGLVAGNRVVVATANRIEFAVVHGRTHATGVSARQRACENKPATKRLPTTYQMG